MLPQAEKKPAARREQKPGMDPSPEPSEGATPRSQTPSLQNCKTNFCCVTYSVCDTWLWQREETDAQVMSTAAITILSQGALNSNQWGT